MFWYRRRQNVKPTGLSGSPWLIGIWRFRPFVRMCCCAAPLATASPSASAKASANRVHRADPGARRMGGSYNDSRHEQAGVVSSRRWPCDRSDCSAWAVHHTLLRPPRISTDLVGVDPQRSRFVTDESCLLAHVKLHSTELRI